MAKIPTSNIKISRIGSEFPREITALGEVQGDTPPHSLSEFRGVTDAIPSSGEVSFSDFADEDSLFTLTVSANTENLNVYTSATSAGWDLVIPVKVIINSGVYIWSDDILLPALTTGILPRGCIIENRGFIMGKGGSGINGNSIFVPQDGGPAISLGCTTILNNIGFVGGGGGAGGQSNKGNNGGGGGAGGGIGGYSSNAGQGGAGGSIGQRGSDGRWAKNSSYKGIGGSAGGSGGDGRSLDKESDIYGSGGGGGRIMPGDETEHAEKGGFGGGPEQNGGLGSDSRAGDGGGGWGADGGGIGGAGGAAVVKNGNTLIVQGRISRIYGAY